MNVFPKGDPRGIPNICVTFKNLKLARLDNRRPYFKIEVQKADFGAV